MKKILSLLGGMLVFFISIFGGVYAAPANHILITEVEYDAVQGGTDTDYEWMELFNPTPNIVSLSGWTFQDNADGPYVFNNTAIIYPGQYFLLVNSGAGFTINYPSITPTFVIKPSVLIGLRLANTTDFLLLKDNLGNIIDQVYRNTGAWSTIKTSPTDSGKSICRNGSSDSDTSSDWLNNCTTTPKLGSLEYVVSLSFSGNNYTTGSLPMMMTGVYYPSIPGSSSGLVLPGTGTMERIGYTFSGWNSMLDGSGTGYAVGSIFVVQSGNSILYAQWTPIIYQAAYDANGGTGLMNNQGFVYGIAQNFTSNIFIRTGYTFSGWNMMANGSGTGYSDGENVNNLIAISGTIITLYAQWSINSYSISYTGGGADGGSAPANQTGDYNSTITLAMNTYTRAGYSFIGWDCGSEGGSYTLTGDVICTAEWNINSYIVTFQDYNATFISSGIVTYGSGATAPSNPNRTGYTFSGWNNDFSNVTGDITITAEYMINSYSITFNTDGGTPITAITGDYNNVITLLVSPTKTGYIFSGWLPVLPTNMPAINTIVVAQWTLIPVVIPPSVPVPGGYAGGGAGGYFTKDNCPDGDYSSSYYDSQCGTTPTTGEESMLDDIKSSSSLCTQADYNLSSFQALKKITDKRQFIVCRLYSNSQTMFDTVPEFDYDRIVTREEASRMITKFVQEVLKKDKIRTSNDPLCQFRDLKLANSGLKTYITDSCQYGIFNGTYEHQFLPRQQLNQAHAIATVLRASYGYQDESGSVRFTPYIDMISTKNLTRKTFTRPSDLKILERRGMTRGNLGELMYRVAIDLL